MICIRNVALCQKVHDQLPRLDSFRYYFNYESLARFNCDQLPYGLIAVRFSVKRSRIGSFRFSFDSSFLFARLLLDALEKSFEKASKKLPNGEYLQFVYFSNRSHCKLLGDEKLDKLSVSQPPNDSAWIASISSLLSKGLASRLDQVNETINHLSNSKLFIGKFRLLQWLFINDFDPKKKRARKVD